MFYISTQQGCNIRSAPDADHAREEALKEVGTSNFRHVRPATRKDLHWVATMGGKVPLDVFTEKTFIGEDETESQKALCDPDLFRLHKIPG